MPEDWPVLVSKVMDLAAQPYDYTADVQRLDTPLLIACGDADIFPPSHAAQFFELVGGGAWNRATNTPSRPESRLAILPGLTHDGVPNDPAFVTAVLDFLTH